MENYIQGAVLGGKRCGGGGGGPKFLTGGFGGALKRAGIGGGSIGSISSFTASRPPCF